MRKGDLKEDSMAGLKKLAGAYLIVVAVVVAVFFVINTVLAESFDFDVVTTWYVLDVLMLIGLIIALIYNFAAKREATRPGDDEAVTRRYLEVNVLFYATVVVIILFLHNWLSLLALGSDRALGVDSSDFNHQAWVIWAVVDTLLPITLGITGCHLWCGTSES